MKVLIVIGTRPEAIKMSHLINLIEKDSKLDLRVCVTAQHRKMLDQILNLFKIKPHYDLDIMKKNQSLNNIASLIIKKMDKILTDFNPHLVLIHGDTATTVCSAIASFNQNSLGT